MEFISEYIANYQNVWWHYVVVWIVSFFFINVITAYLLERHDPEEFSIGQWVICINISVVFASLNCIFLAVLLN